MKHAKKYLLVAMLLFAQPRAKAQGFQIDSLVDAEGGYFPYWDSVQDRLIMFRDAKASGAPVARIFKPDGTGTPIYPLTDLTGAWHIDVWGVAATPEGGVVLSAIVGYTAPAVTPAQVRRLLLTYDGSGKLTKVWNVSPYHHHLLAIDRSGNIFGLGDANLNQPYPLIVKYSPTGRVLREFLPSSAFPNGDEAAGMDSPNGGPHMFIRNNELFVWIASSQELFRYSLAGDLLSRTSFATALNALAAQTNSDHVYVQFLMPTEQGDISAQVQLWPRKQPNPLRSVMVTMSGDGSKTTMLPAAPDRGWFLGITSQGKSVYFEPEPTGRAAKISSY